MSNRILQGKQMASNSGVSVQKWRRKVGDEFDENEKAAFLDFMRRMLSFGPEDRLTVEEVLKSEWMVKWALPDHERS